MSINRNLFVYFGLFVFCGLVAILAVLGFFGRYLPEVLVLLTKPMALTIYLLGIYICFEIGRAKNSQYPVWVISGLLVAGALGPFGVLFMASLHRKSEQERKIPFSQSWEFTAALAIAVWLAALFIAALV